ncbi:MAG: four helix bundle protein [Bacteroidales bacterium]|nr:four helix bundle protein [Bacteroidales bacterium]MDY6346811.1 four helix bundle protein [Bacteroidales bacterium]
MNERDNNVSFFRFEDLRIYAKAMDYIVWLYQNLPADDGATNKRFMQKSFLKSAQEIALNTAEGSSRNRTQFLYYLKMAKSSVRECVVLTDIAHRCGIIGDDAREHSRTELMELTKMIGSLIASLQRTSGSSSSQQKDDMDDLSMPEPADFDDIM